MSPPVEDFREFSLLDQFLRFLISLVLCITPILGSRYEKVQDHNIIGRRQIAVPTSYLYANGCALRIYSKLLDLLKVHRKGTNWHQACVGQLVQLHIKESWQECPQDPGGFLPPAHDLHVQECQNLVCGMISIANVTESCRGRECLLFTHLTRWQRQATHLKLDWYTMSLSC